MADIAYVALGSNIGNVKENIRIAVDALGSVPGVKVISVSELYETKPWGYEEQNNFCNAAARLSVDVSPEALLGICLGIEAGMGRVRKIHNGPRIIDIDLIIYNGQSRNTKELILPHPRMNERDFVLVPLLDVAEDEMKDDIKEKIAQLKEKYVV